MYTLFPFISLGEGLAGLYFHTQISEPQPGSASDLPSQFLASLFPLLGLSKLPGMFWTLSALVAKRGQESEGSNAHRVLRGTRICRGPVLQASDCGHVIVNVQ